MPDPGKEKQMTNVQTVDSGTSSTPRAQLVETRGRLVIRVARTAELNEALASLAKLGVRQLGYRFRFYDDGDVALQFTGRRGAGRNQSVLPEIKAARHRLGELFEDAIREATEESMGLDRELHCECEAALDPRTGSWQLSGRGTVYEIDPDFSDVGLVLD